MLTNKQIKPAPIIIFMIAVFLLYGENLYSQVFQVKEVSNKVSVISNPNLGSQVVVQTEKGMVVFDSFWSGKTARVFKNEIEKTFGRKDFSYVVNMVDRLDMIGGNVAYPEAAIVGHEYILAKYSTEKYVREEINKLIEMWRGKEGYSRDRLPKYKKGSEEEMEEKKWLSKCITMADELENSFSLVLPQISYNDKLTLNLGNTEIDLFWFGNIGDNKGLTMAVIGEEKLAILSKIVVFPDGHLAPFPHPYYGDLDVPRWIAMLEKILEGENAVNNIILSDSSQVYSRERMKIHLKYIRKLWNSVKNKEEAGKTFEEIQDQLSLEKDFAFVKDMPVYKTEGDDWIRPQHEAHIKHFYLQDKILDSEIIKNGRPVSLQALLDKIKKPEGK